MLKLGVRRRLGRLEELARQGVQALRTYLGITDTKRWARTGQETPYWDERNILVGALVPPGTSVLDIGCGAQTLRRYLPEGCAYQPCDIIAHDENVWAWDFNKGPFPHPDRSFDVAVMSGVLEYADDPRALLATAKGLAGQIVLTYSSLEARPSRFTRRAAGWRNDLRKAELEAILTDLGLHFDHVTRWDGEQELYRIGREPLGPRPELPEVRQRRLTVCGSFGFHNAGDEAAWQAVSDLTKAAGLAVDLDVLTRFDDPSMAEVIGLGERDAERRRRLAGQPLLYVGGGIVEPNDIAVILSSQQLHNEVAVPRYAFLGVNAEQGVEYPGPLRRRLRRILENAAYVSGRDPLSQAVLKDLAPKVDVGMTGDVVLWLEPAEERPAPLRDLEAGAYIAVTLTPRWKDEAAWRPWISRELIALARGLDAPLAFIPCSSKFDDDRQEHAAVAALLREAAPELTVVEIDEHVEPRPLLAAFRDARLTVGMRLHACVMAYAQRTPLVGLTYHPKIQGFGRAAGIEPFILPTRPVVRGTKEAYGYTFAETGLEAESLAGIGERAVAETSFERLDELKDRTRAALVRFMRAGDEGGLDGPRSGGRRD
ncbi:MAG: polysaccharide pyruvyl transferase family protein [Sandaracinaceae bacterium]